MLQRNESNCPLANLSFPRLEMIPRTCWPNGTPNPSPRQRTQANADFQQWKKLTGSYRTADLTREMINRKLLIPNPEGKNSVSIRVPGHGQMRLYHLAPMGEPEAT